MTDETHYYGDGHDHGDPLEDAYPICGTCLRPCELDETPAGLAWICECGVTPAAP